MNIVVLDGYTLNPGDLDWDALKKLGDVTVYDRTPVDQVVERAMNAPIVLTNKTTITRDAIEQLPLLKYIGVLATGYNIVDVEAAYERRIRVANIPDYSTSSVAQLTFALLMELTFHVGHHAQTTREGRWQSSTDFCYWDKPLIEIAGQTFGVIGYGRIGQMVAKIAQSFGMNVVAYSRSRTGTEENGVKFVSLEAIFHLSDVISLHCPLTPETKHLINKERLSRMKPTSFLLNTGRGPLIDEAALAEALNEGKIAGAGLDVLSIEPPKNGNPLLTAKNCLVTPHIAWATKAARTRLMEIAVNNVKAFLDGAPVNVVNWKV
jgi:glycerate dehydrogenase